MGKTDPQINDENMDESFVDLFDFDVSGLGDIGKEETQKENTDALEDADELEDNTNKPEVIDDSETVDDTIDDTDKDDAETPEIKTDDKIETDDDELEDQDDTVSEIGTLLQELTESDVLDFDEDKEYAPTAEGVKDIINQTVSKGIEKYKQSLGDEGQEVLNILTNGGSIQDYINSKEEIDFNSIPLKLSDGKPNTNNQSLLVEDLYKLQGYTSEEIKEKINDLNEAGLLEKEAITAKSKLAKHQATDKEAKMKNEIAAKEAARVASVKDAADFKTKVTGIREIAGFNITKTEAEKLHTFITKREADGKTAYEKKDTDENRLLYAYQAMTGFGKAKLEKQVRSKQTLKLKKKLSNYKDVNAKRTSSDKQVRNDPNETGEIYWDINR